MDDFQYSVDNDSDSGYSTDLTLDERADLALHSAQKDDSGRALAICNHAAETGRLAGVYESEDNALWNPPVPASKLGDRFKTEVLSGPGGLPPAKVVAAVRDRAESVSRVYDTDKSIEQREKDYRDEIKKRGYTKQELSELDGRGLVPLDPKDLSKGFKYKEGKTAPTGAFYAESIDETALSIAPTSIPMTTVMGPGMDSFGTAYMAYTHDANPTNTTVVKYPVLHSWVAGPRENKAADQLEKVREYSAKQTLENLKNGDASYELDLNSLNGLSVSEQKEVVQMLTRDVWMMYQLHYWYGNNWRDFPSGVLSYEIQRIAEQNGQDPNDFNWKRLTKMGAGSLSWLRHLTPLADTMENITSASRLQRLKNVNMADAMNNWESVDYSTREDILATLLEASNGLRGTTAMNTVVSTTLDMIPFMLPFFAAGGTGPVLQAGTKLLSKAGAKQVAAYMGRAALQGTVQNIMYGGFAEAALSAAGEPAYITPFVDGESGDVIPGMTYDETSKLSERLVNALVNQEIEIVSEYMGGLFELIPVSRLAGRLLSKGKVAERLRNKFIIGALTSPRAQVAWRNLSRNAAIHGTIGEWGEEKIGSLARVIATDIAEYFDMEYLNLKEHSVFGSLEDEALLMASLSAGTSIFRIPAALVNNPVRAMRMYDKYNAVLDKMQEAKMEGGDPNAQHFNKVILQSAGVQGTGGMSAEDARALYQTVGAETAERIGLTEEKINAAEENGTTVSFLMADLFAFAPTDVSRAMLSKIIPESEPLSFGEIDDLDLTEEGVARKLQLQKEEKEFQDVYRDLLAQLSAAGRSAKEVSAIGKIIALGAASLGAHNTRGIRPVDILRKLTIISTSQKSFEDMLARGAFGEALTKVNPEYREAIRRIFGFSENDQKKNEKKPVVPLAKTVETKPEDKALADPVKAKEARNKRVTEAAKATKDTKQKADKKKAESKAAAKAKTEADTKATAAKKELDAAKKETDKAADKRKKAKTKVETAGKKVAQAENEEKRAEKELKNAEKKAKKAPAEKKAEATKEADTAKKSHDRAKKSVESARQEEKQAKQEEKQAKQEEKQAKQEEKQAQKASELADKKLKDADKKRLQAEEDSKKALEEAARAEMQLKQEEAKAIIAEREAKQAETDAEDDANQKALDRYKAAIEALPEERQAYFFEGDILLSDMQMGGELDHFLAARELPSADAYLSYVREKRLLAAARKYDPNNEKGMSFSNYLKGIVYNVRTISNFVRDTQKDRAVSLDAEVGSGEDATTLENFIPGEDGNAAERIEENDLISRATEAAVEKLSAKLKEMGFKPMETDRYIVELFNELARKPTLNEFNDRLAENGLEPMKKAAFSLRVNKVIPIYKSIVRDVLTEQGFHQQDALGALTRLNADWEATMALFRGKANASTVVHETAHFLFDMMQTLVLTGAADAQMMKDYRALVDWSKEGTSSITEAEERIAVGVEKYCLEGEAPEVVKGAFETLRQFLMQVYRSFVALANKIKGIEIPADIQEVFSRMIGADLIANRDSLTNPIVQQTLDSLLGAPNPVRASFSVIAGRAAVQQREANLKHVNKDIKAHATEWRKEAIEKQKEIPVYRVWNALKAEGKQLSYSAVEKLAGKETADALLKNGAVTRNADNALHPADVAKAGGYDISDTTVVQMLRDLASSLTPKAYVDKYILDKTKQRLREITMSEEAMTTEASIQAFERLYMELALKVGKSQHYEQLAELRRRVRENVLAGKVDGADTVGKLLRGSPRFQGTCKKLVDRLAKALKKNDHTAAFEALRDLRYCTEVLRVIGKVHQDANTIRSYVNRIRHLKNGTIDGTCANVIRTMATLMGLTQTATEFETITDALDKLNEEREADGRTGYRPGETLIRLFNDQSCNWTTMTPGEFSDVRDAVEAFYHEGRSIVSDSKDSVKARVIGTDENPGFVKKALASKSFTRRADTKTNTEGTWWGKLKKGWRNMNPLRTLFSILTDEDKTHPLWEMYQTLYRASSKQYQLLEPIRSEVSKQLKALDKILDAVDTSKIKQKFPDNVVRENVAWNKETLLCVCLNMGREKNRQRLLAGFGWTPSDLADIATTIPAEAWTAIQAIWDTFANAELHKAEREAFRKTNNYDFKEEEPFAFTVNYADGTTLPLKGGYYPISYLYHNYDFGDNDVKRNNGGNARSIDVGIPDCFKDANEKMFDPLRLDLSVLHIGLMERAHYAAFAEPMQIALRVINNREFREAVQHKFGYEFYSVLRKSVERVANPGDRARAVMNSFLRFGRSVMVSRALWGELSPILMQLTSFTVGLNEVGADNYANALAEIAKEGPLKAWHDATELSPFLRDRFNMAEIDLQKATDAFDEKLIKKMWENAKETGYLGTKFMDAVVALPAWLAMYNKCINEGMSKENAIAEADEFLAATQGGARDIDLSEAQVSVTGQMLTVFYSAASAVYQQQMKSVRNFGKAARGEITWGAAAGSALCNIMLPVMMAALIRFLLAGAGTGDDEDLDRALMAALREIISAPFAGIPLVRDIADTTAYALTGKQKSQGSALTVPAAEGIESLSKALSRGFGELTDGNFAEFVYDASDAVSSAVGMPVVHVYERVMKTLKNFDKSVPNPRDIVK